MIPTNAYKSASSPLAFITDALSHPALWSLQSQFHCFLTSLIFSYQCSYTFFQASNKATHMEIALYFTKNPENLTSTIRPTRRKFTV